MHFKFRNVNDAFRGLVEGMHTGKIPTYICASRAGEVAMIEEPVIVTYTHPTERVLLNKARDANPFFHLYEALWMLAGRNDMAPLAYYNSRMTEFSDDGDTFNGAYGYRWRQAAIAEPGKDYYETVNWVYKDQLKILINHLRSKPESRRAVLQMWNVEDDLLKIDSSKDVCCNLSVCFSIGQGNCKKCKGRTCTGPPCDKCKGMLHDQPRYLNMTVFNRSNDLIWGMLGANVVHFSILQEYVAAHLDLDVGEYNQVTNNLHVYTKNWKPEEWLAEYNHNPTGGQADYPKHTKLVNDPETFDKELPFFVDSGVVSAEADWCSEPFLRDVARPMLLAFRCCKEFKPVGSYRWHEMIKSDDWRQAAMSWIENRENKRAASAK